MKNWSIWKPYNVWTARLVPFIWPFISWPSHVPRCRVGRIRKRLSASTTMRLYNGPAGMLILDGKAGHINTLKPPYRNFFGSLYLKICGCILYIQYKEWPTIYRDVQLSFYDIVFCVVYSVLCSLGLTTRAFEVLQNPQRTHSHPIFMSFRNAPFSFKDTQHETM